MCECVRLCASVCVCARRGTSGGAIALRRIHTTRRRIYSSVEVFNSFCELRLCSKEVWDFPCTVQKTAKTVNFCQKCEFRPGRTKRDVPTRHSSRCGYTHTHKFRPVALSLLRDPRTEYSCSLPCIA